MANETDLNLLNRSIRGDWQSRVDFFQKFITDNRRLLRIGARYGNIDDFRHDCFTNILRTSSSIDPEEKLSSWVEWVGLRTAMDRDRVRKPADSGLRNRIRMCAASEGDNVEDYKAVSYVPPRGGPNDSPEARISSIVGEPQFTLLRKLAAENITWEEAAKTVGKPLMTVGPMLVHELDRLSRFFGAPPPLNNDLEQVFSEIRARESAIKHSDPLKSKGRLFPMRFDPPFYALTPELRKIGLAVPDEVRTLTLWDAARSSTPLNESLKEHLSDCRYCTDLLGALKMLQRALQGGNSADFLFCPGSSTLVKFNGEDNQALELHLAGCPACMEERTRVLEGKETNGVQTPGTRANRNRVAWAATGVLLLIIGIGYSAWHRHSTVNQDIAPEPPTTVETRYINSRYKDLAQRIPLDDDRKLMATALPQDRANVAVALGFLKASNVPESMMTCSKILAANPDPAAQMLMAVIYYGQQSPAEGYAAMLKAEALSPRDPYRCWATLQCALMADDAKVVQREAEHLASDPEYGAQAKSVLEKVLARK